MKKYVLALAICLIAAMGATAAFADVFKVVLVATKQTPPGASGLVTLNYVKTYSDQGVDKIEARIRCSRLEKNARYRVARDDKGNIEPIGFFTTTGGGVGHLHDRYYFVDGDVNVDEIFLVIQSEVEVGGKWIDILKDKRLPKT